MSAAELPIRPDIRLESEECLQRPALAEFSLSILIPTRDRRLLIQPCLRSLAATVNRPDVEVLIGDTGSKDPAVFDDYREFARGFRGGVRLVRFSGYHFSSNLNGLANLARGETLIILNNDTFALPGWEQPLLECLDRAGVGAAGPKLLFHNGTIQHAGVEFVDRGLPKYLGYHPHCGRNSAMPDANIELTMPAVTGACLAIRRATYLAHGGFDLAYREEAQDVDLCLKLWRAGLSSVYVPRSTLYHLENGSRTVVEDHADRRLFVGRWRNFIDAKFLSRREQGVPTDVAIAEGRAASKRVCFLREEARGDVLASTAIVRAYRERHPGVHITYKTLYPDLVDATPSVDRAIGVQDHDGWKYDEVLRPEYESGAWQTRPGTTWLEEMARSCSLDPAATADFRPQVAFTTLDRATRAYYAERARKQRYVVVATGAGWPEREWSPAGWDNLAVELRVQGYDVFQIGGGLDHRVGGALHLLDRRLHENLAILESARALITLDSYPLHLGAAMGLPTLVLTCKTCAQTVKLPPNAVELRHREAASTPRPECRIQGCRERKGNGLEDRCATPILKDLPARVVLAALESLLRLASAETRVSPPELKEAALDA